MRSDVCATLTAVFPLVLLAVVAQRPMIHRRIRVSRGYRVSVRTTVSCSLMGLLAAVVGQQLGGVPLIGAVFLGCLLVIDVACLGFTVIASMASFELEEERPLEQKASRRRAARASLRTSGARGARRVRTVE